jgi:hypothetical protein
LLAPGARPGAIGERTRAGRPRASEARRGGVGARRSNATTRSCVRQVQQKPVDGLVVW